MTNIEQAIKKILDGGTKIVSFTYDGKARNVLIGANACGTQGVWGEQINRAVRKYNGKKYLVARVMNDKDSCIKCFNLDKIFNPSPALS